MVSHYSFCDLDRTFVNDEKHSKTRSTTKVAMATSLAHINDVIVSKQC